MLMLDDNIWLKLGVLPKDFTMPIADQTSEPHSRKVIS